MPQIIVNVGRQMQGITFQLDPHTRAMLAARNPAARPVSSVFVAFDTRQAFEQHQGPRWALIVMLLTGLNAKEIAELGGFRLVDPVAEETLFQSKAA